MKAKKPDKCIKAQCGASCDFHTTFGAWLMRRDEHRDKAMNLIPKSILEDIRAEIDSYCSDNRDRNDGLYIAMRIIDKHLHEIESEG